MTKLNEPIEYIKGVGPNRARLLKSELGLKTMGDLLMYYPFRHEDRSKIYTIKELGTENINVTLKGTLKNISLIGHGHKQRLTAKFKDDTGTIELVWFKGAKWIEKSLAPNKTYHLFGRVTSFNGRKNIAHPELELSSSYELKPGEGLHPVYSTTEKLIKSGLDAKGIARVMRQLFNFLQGSFGDENIPEYIINKLRLIPRKEALLNIHFPSSEAHLRQAYQRLKFEELFFLQLELLFVNRRRKSKTQGIIFDKVGDYFNQFYSEKLPFKLTNAQKKVIKEIRKDIGSGKQMNRLLQGDVGSGKTIVSLMCMLIAIDNGYQTCLMAPTEILAQQHYQSISDITQGLGIDVGFLSGTVKGKKRAALLEKLASGEIHILIGTHAVIEDPVIFHNLGFAITDEQHRFGVNQRGRLWKKSRELPPHILVMTATPIPRTLAMTYYGDLDISVIDELPPGRKPINTHHLYDSKRSYVNGFIKKEIKSGRQIYIVYPLIEESEKLDLQNLQDGYEYLLSVFPRPDYQIGIVHGRMKAADKESEMQRFKNGSTQILVATTVIEVGVNVPNATVMVIENSERFGLSQLHQLRGRVGRGGEQSHCILMSSFKLSKEAKKRLKTMTSTNDGFEIAEVDLEIRGPGVIAGTRQSGELGLQLANLAQDGRMLKTARELVKHILESDPNMEDEKHLRLRKHIIKNKKRIVDWSKIG